MADTLRQLEAATDKDSGGDILVTKDVYRALLNNTIKSPDLAYAYDKGLTFKGASIGVAHASIHPIHVLGTPSYLRFHET